MNVIKVICIEVTQYVWCCVIGLLALDVPNVDEIAGILEASAGVAVIYCFATPEGCVRATKCSV
jgi:hypothetical protein